MYFLRYIPFMISATAFAQQVVPTECYNAFSRNAWGTSSTIKVLAKCTIDFSAGGTIAFKGDHTGTPWGSFPGGWMNFTNIPEGYLFIPTSNQKHILNVGDELVLEYLGKTAATNITLYTGSNPPSPPVATYGVLQFSNPTGFNFTAHLDNKDNPQDVVINGTDLNAKILVGKYSISVPPVNSNGNLYVISADPNPVTLTENQTVNIVFSAKQIPTNKIFFPYIETSALTDPTQPKPNGWSYPFSKLADLAPIGIYNVTIAFVLSDGKCGGDFYSQNYNVNLKSQISNFQSNGGRVIASFGGANGPYIEEQYMGNNCVVAGEKIEVTLAKAYEKFIDNYNIRYLDFDIEGSAISNTNQVDLRNKAIAVMQSDPKYSDVKISYTLPVLPTGVLDNSIQLLNNANTNKVVVDRINIMTMDYGSDFPPNRMGDNAIMAAENLYKQIKPIYPNASSAELYNKIGITPMIGYNDVRPEVFTLADASQVYIYAQSKGIGLLSFWSLNRDQACASGTVSSVCSGIPTQKPFDFAKKFMGQ